MVFGSALVALAVGTPVPTDAATPEGLVVKAGQRSVSATVDALEALVKRKGFTVFARVDHAAGAAKVDLDLPDAQVLIFGNPKGGTPLMQASLSIALDLPLRVLVHAEGEGVRIVYTDPVWLAERHGIPVDHPVVKKVRGALDRLTDAIQK